MSRRIPLTFEKGVLESVRASMLPLGFTTKLENWQPEPDGNLRCRTGWVSASTTGAPATRRVRGIGRYQSLTSYQSTTVVQNQRAGGTTTTAAPTWASATTTGNCLILIVSYSGDTAGLTVPAGWTLARESNNGSVVGMRVYYKANAASESGAVNISKSAGRIEGRILELSGISGSPLDQVASATGTSTTGSTGTTASTTDANEYWLAVVVNDNLANHNSPTNGFSQLGFSQSGSPGLTTGVYAKSVSATGTASMSVSISLLEEWAGAVITLKRAAVTAASASLGFLTVAQQEATGHAIYHISTSGIASGSWSLIETVANSAPSWPVSFASGLTVMLYTSPYFSTLRRYDGSTAAAVAGSPPGRFVVFHKNRFFVGGTTEHPSRLWYSQLGDYTTWWKADKGETSLADSTNYIDIDEDDGDALEDAIPFEDGLLMVKEGSVHFLTGTGPDTFDRQRFNTGGGMAGRCLCATPYGAVIAAKNEIGIWSGGGVDAISKPIEASYAITGDFVSTAYLDGVVRVCDEGTGTTYCLNMLTGSWYMEKVDNANEAPAVLFTHRNRLYMGPKAATSGSLLSYRQIAAAATKDPGSGTETFRAWTGELWPEGPDHAITPLNIFVRYRQIGAGTTTVTVTPYYDGTVGTALTIPARNAEGAGWHTVQVVSDSLGKGVRHFQAKFESIVSAASASLIEIEECILEYDVDRDF